MQGRVDPVLEWGRHASLERHAGARAQWLPAAVREVDEGVVPSASLTFAVLAAPGSPSGVLTAGIAGLVAGAVRPGPS